MLHSDIQLLLVTPINPNLPIGGVSAIFDRNLNTNTVLGMDVAAPQSAQFINRLGLPSFLPTVSLDVNLSSGTYDEGYAVGNMKIHYMPSGKHTPGVISQGKAIVTIHAQIYTTNVGFILQCQYQPLMRSPVMADRSAFENVTHDRLSRLERELRCWRAGGIIILSVAAVVITGAMAQPAAKELRVETLRIVERDGKDRLVLTAVPGVPDMTFLDPGGHTRLTLDIADDNRPVLAVAESGKAKGRLTLGIENGSPMLQLYDRDGTKRVTIGVPKDVGSLIRIFDADGRVIARIP